MESQSWTFSFGMAMYLYYIAWILLGIVGSIWIYRDAKKLPKLFLGSKPAWWAAATILLGPIWVFIAYWLIHHSSISNRISSEYEINKSDNQ